MSEPVDAPAGYTVAAADDVADVAVVGLGALLGDETLVHAVDDRGYRLAVSAWLAPRGCV